MNKRGDVNWVMVSLVLGVLVLVVLGLGFGIGWNKLFPFLFSSNNVESIKTSCAAACATNNVYSYCTQKRTLKAVDLPDGIKEKEETCNFFATDTGYTNYRIESCSTFDCSQ